MQYLVLGKDGKLKRGGIPGLKPKFEYWTRVFHIHGGEPFVIIGFARWNEATEEFEYHGLKTDWTPEKYLRRSDNQKITVGDVIQLE